MESNDSPEIPDRGETSDIPGLPSGVGPWTHWAVDTLGRGHIRSQTHWAVDTMGRGHIGPWTHWAADTLGRGYIGSWTHWTVDTSGLGHIGSWTHWAVDTAICFPLALRRLFGGKKKEKSNYIEWE